MQFLQLLLCPPELCSEADCELPIAAMYVDIMWSAKWVGVGLLRMYVCSVYKLGGIRRPTESMLPSRMQGGDVMQQIVEIRLCT